VIPQELAALDFAAGSMGPKVQAACDFVNHGGGMAGIGALEDVSGLLMRHAGTRVVPRHGA
jgi:carbamate kinase